MPRQRIDHGAVVSAALALADSEGIHELALGRVADDLGVQTSALYNHVDGVDGLRNDVSTQALSNLTSTLRDAAVARSGEDALRAVAHAYRTFASDNPGQYGATLLPPSVPDDERAADNKAITDLFLQILAGLGVEGPPALHRARSLRSAIHGFVALESIEAFEHDEPRDASFAELVEVLVRGVAAPT